jgi:hypothetical protein
MEAIMRQHYYCSLCGNTTVSFVTEVTWDDYGQMWEVKDPDTTESPAWCKTCENETRAIRRIICEAVA